MPHGEALEAPGGMTSCLGAARDDATGSGEKALRVGQMTRLGRFARTASDAPEPGQRT